MKFNNRLANITEYHFKKIDDIKNARLLEGKEVLDLGIGDPDLAVNSKIVQALIKGTDTLQFNKYPPYDGIRDLKKAVIQYYYRNYSVSLTEEEVLILIGSKEGISNLIPAVCNIGDTAIIPKPGYPAYESCCWLWGVQPYKIPLTKETSFLPSLKTIPETILAKSKLFIINYPNNPLGVVANLDFFKELINFCVRHDIVLCNDGAYSEIIKENAAPISLLQSDYKKQTIEFGTFSKTYNMSGFRIGYAVGNAEIIKSLLKVKTNVDSGQFKPIQLAALEALKLDSSYIKQIRKVYDERREAAEKILAECKINYVKPEGTFYIWCEVPKGYTVDTFCEEILDLYGIVVTPGSIFEGSSSSYFRISLTKDKSQIEYALKKLTKYTK